MSLLLRVASIVIKDTTFNAIRKRAEQVVILWRVLVQCVMQAEQRAQAHFGSASIPAAFIKMEVVFLHGQRPHMSIIGPLTTEFPCLARSLRILTIAYNTFDESADLGPFAALASRLRELTFECCGLTSVHALARHCENLQILSLNGCNDLGSLIGLEHHAFLRVIRASYTGITCIEPLRTCPALTKVDASGCEQLSSIEGLEDHQWLQEVDVSDTAITSIEPLRTCPALTRVVVSDCQHLFSIAALEGHQWLHEVNASQTAIASVEPLLACPALSKVYLRGCEQLPKDVDLDPCVRVIR